ncbi:hypothetical protein AAFN46_02300 [Pseudomonas sp. CAU 1711]|uniref:hypothetical protein n=1 Tax=Pseudomonas sp. CAU 1711 TaxID=3140356 RepID=UPI003260CF63
MHKPNRTDRPAESVVHPQPAEPDFTEPSGDKVTHLPPPDTEDDMREAPDTANPWNALRDDLRPALDDPGATP